MKKIFVLAFIAIFVSVGLFAGAQEKPDAIKVLLITGDDVAPYHDWREIAECTRDALESCAMIKVKICADEFILESKTALDKYNVIFLTGYFSKEPKLSDLAKKNLIEFVKGGKGFVATHLASASFKEWDEFRNLCAGRVWVMGKSGHGPRGVFECNVVNKDHVITKGLSDFKIFDELYARLQGDAEMEVLVSAKSDFTGNVEPLVFVKNYGKGRVVHNALGHDFKAIKDVNNQKLLVRSCFWAANVELPQGCNMCCKMK